MSVNLIAGGNVSLTAGNPLLDDIVIGFGWNVIKAGGPMTEVVPSAIMCDASGKALSDDHFVFFNQLVSPDGAVTYVSGDDKEQIEVTLSLVPEKVAKIVFVVYADPDVRKPGNFGSVRGAYIRVAGRDDADIVRFNIPDDSNHAITSMVFGELYRHAGGWKFRAVGQGYATGLVGVAKDYGVDV